MKYSGANCHLLSPPLMQKSSIMIAKPVLLHCYKMCVRPLLKMYLHLCTAHADTGTYIKGTVA